MLHVRITSPRKCFIVKQMKINKTNFEINETSVKYKNKSQETISHRIFVLF